MLNYWVVGHLQQVSPGGRVPTLERYHFRHTESPGLKEGRKEGPQE